MYARQIDFNDYSSTIIENELIVPLLNVVQNETDRKRRMNAIIALNYKSNTLIAPILCECIKIEEDLEMKREMLHAASLAPMGIEKENEVFDLFIQLFDRKDLRFQHRALELWAVKKRIFPDSEAQWVISILKSEDLEMRVAAIDALNIQKSLMAIEPLIDLINSEIKELAWSKSILALMNLSISFYSQIKDQGFEDLYIEMLSSEDPDVLKQAFKVLRRIGTEKSYSIIVDKANLYRQELEPLYNLAVYARDDIKARMEMYYEYISQAEE